MAGLVRPRNYPIRSVTDNKNQLGMIFNPARYPDHGGFTSQAAMKGKSEFSVEPPTRTRTAEVSKRGTQE